MKKVVSLLLLTLLFNCSSNQEGLIEKSSIIGEWKQSIAIKKWKIYLFYYI